jgi:hypothetical protein
MADMLSDLPIAPGSSPQARAIGGMLDQARKEADAREIATIDNFRVGGIKTRPTYFEKRDNLFARIPVGRMQAEAVRTAAFAQRQLESDVAAIDSYNRAAGDLDDRVTTLLKPFSGEDFGDDLASWGRWSADLRGYAQTAPSQTRTTPTIVEDVPLAYQPVEPPIPLVSGGSSTVLVSHSCFAAGTMVKTRTGERPIESIAAGDVVLSRDTSTGGLSFQPILAVFHNPPAATVRVALGTESIVATGIHRFWVAGRGWTMARDLKPGDPVRTVDGTVKVASVEADRNQKVYNLEVGRGHSFFVGTLGALVHDNSLVQPTPEPFDAPTDSRPGLSR